MDARRHLEALARRIQLVGFALALILCPISSDAVEIGLEPVATGIPSPLLVTHAGDGSGRLFVVARQGQIHIVTPDDEVLETPFLNIKVATVSEGGLLGMAFHPDYETNGFFYVYYTSGTVPEVNVSRFSVSESDPDVADPSSELVLLHTYGGHIHLGGMIAFGPRDHYLYIAMGESVGGDPAGDLGGSILRIDVDRQEDGLNYAIPPDNPFVGNTEGIREEIFARGLRNPWRFSFDRVTGTLFCGDVGEHRREEVNIITPGSHYGWPTMEGSLCSHCDPTEFTLPHHEYAHDGEIPAGSVTGGYVYRGSTHPEWDGLYFFGDFWNRHMWTLEEIAPGVWSSENVVLFGTVFPISSFGEDEQGELYVCDFYNGGSVFRIVGTATLPSTPKSSITFIEHPIVTRDDRVFYIAAADLDNDGDMDVVTSSGGTIVGSITWYEQDNETPPVFSAHDLATSIRWRGRATPIDLDGDGDQDVISTFRTDTPHIIWFENDGAMTPSFSSHVAPSTSTRPKGIFSVDIDGDEDMDVLLASGVSAEWFENDGESPPRLTAHPVIESSESYRSIALSDLDGDNDLDIITDVRDGAMIRWYENNGASPPIFAARTIVTPSPALSVFAADMDNDGDIDLISLHDGLGKELVWHENDGAKPPNFTNHAIPSSAYVLTQVTAADFDQDGDNDIFSGYTVLGKTFFFANDGTERPMFTGHEIDSPFARAETCVPIDMDGDGDLDIVAALGRSPSRIVWYENIPLSNAGVDPGNWSVGYK